MEHDRIVNDIFLRLNRIEHQNQIINIKQEYDLEGKLGSHGEIDVYEIFRVNQKYVAYAIEVKGHDCEKSRNKATHQLDKDIEYLTELFPALNKIICFYAYSRGNKYNVERIRVIDYDKMGHYNQEIEDRTCW